jgi:hypothetical protein
LLPAALLASATSQNEESTGESSQLLKRFKLVVVTANGLLKAFSIESHQHLVVVKKNYIDTNIFTAAINMYIITRLILNQDILLFYALVFRPD